MAGDGRGAASARRDNREFIIRTVKICSIGANGTERALEEYAATNRQAPARGTTTRRIP